MSEFEETSGATDTTHERIAPNAGETAKEKYVSNVSDMMNDGEVIHHVIRGPNMGTGPTQKSAETTSTGTKGFVTTAFTDERVIVKVPHLLSDDRYSIRYGKVQGVELNSEGIMATRSLSVHTSGKSYWISIMGNMEETDLDDIIAYVDDMISEDLTIPAAKSRTTQERLEELNELHENDLISDSEYESKRTEILDGL